MRWPDRCAAITTAAPARAASIAVFRSSAFSLMRGCRSRPGVGLLVDAKHLLRADVSVPLRGGKGSVAEELLDRAEVGASIEKVRREGVPEAVRGDPVLHRALQEARLEDAPHAPIGQARAAFVHEERVRPSPRG